MARVLVRLGLVLSVLAAFVLAPAQDMTQDQKQAVLNALGDVVMHEAYVPGVDFSKWPDLLERHKAQIDLATDVRSFGRVVNQALRDFGFSHIRLASPRATSLRGQTSTVGAGASVVPTPDGLEVRRLIEHGPARDLGLEVGDVITKIDGEKPTSVGDLDGEEGAKKSIEIKKKSGEVKTVELEIKRFSTVTEETISWPEPDTAVIRINTFSAGYGRTNVEDLMDEAAKAKYLVVDLRSNGGGSIFNLMHFLSVVLPNRTDIGTFISRRTADRYTAELPGAIPDPVAIAKWTDRHMRTFSRGHDPFAGKIAVLINRGSASASEIAAAALRDNARAKLVGTRSAGAVLASTYRRLPDGWSIQYPVSDFVTSKFVRIEGHPLQPDVEVIGRPTPDDPDPAVAAAIKSLKG